MTNMPLSDPDSVPLAAFPLAWRWTQPNQHLLAPSVLATIRAFSPTAASKLDPNNLLHCREGTDQAPARRVATDGDQSVVRDWLEGLSVGPSEPVIISWDNTTAIATIWQTFADHWDAFCYPSSDDVAISAPACDWVLCYSHYEVLELRFRNAAA